MTVGRPSVLIIGAGLGGVATAGRLAIQGHDVTVVEKRSEPGGRCGRVERDGYRFDLGPTLYLMPRVWEDTFAAMGGSVEDALDLKRVDPTYRIHFRDESWIDLTADLVRMREQMEAIEPGAFEGYLDFMRAGYTFYENSLDDFVGRNFYSLLDYFGPSNMRMIFKLKPYRTHYKHTSQFFSDPRLIAAMSFQNMYLGVSPYEAMATYALLQYTELAEGVWFPEGGMHAIVEALVEICRDLGVEFRMDCPIDAIDTSRSQAEAAISAEGERIERDIIIANADLPYVYTDLLPDEGHAERIRRKRYSCSTLVFYWGIQGKRSPNLRHHNVFINEDRYKESFDRIFKDLTVPDEPSYYICAPTRSGADYAPPDGDSLMVLVPVGHIDEKAPQDWDAIEEHCREAVFAGLERIGAGISEDDLVVDERVGPERWRDMFNLRLGSTFGLSHNFSQVGYLRPHNRHPDYGNLYFVGASTHPGTGLPLVLLSARNVTERVMREQ